MRVNLAVSGKFHYHNYVRLLDERGLLNKFYYSHRFSTNSHALGVAPERLVNAWIKEYLTGFHLRVARLPMAEEIKPYYRALWRYWTLMRWSKADLLHIMLHGAGQGIISRARRDGAIIVGEPVNAHPEYLFELVAEEYERLGIKHHLSLGLALRRIIEEAKASDHLLVASDFLARSFVAKGWDAGRIHVIPYGVDLSRFSPLEEHEWVGDGVFRVICVASLSVRKGHCDLLEAWKQLALPNAELLLVGRLDPEMKPVFDRYAGLYRHIARVPNTELRKYYGTSSVFVLPSIEDGFGMVCSEAMACGLPVITTTNAGAAELISEGVDGYVVPVRSPEQIADRIQALYNDADKRGLMSEAALRKARQSMTWEKYVDLLVDVYESAASGISARAPTRAG